MTPEKLPLESDNPVDKRLEALQALLPEIFSDGKIDLERFKTLLGDELDSGRERFGLSWAGKAEAVRAVQILTRGALRPQRDDSVDFEATGNAIIEGDNLEVLKVLQRSYHNKIKMIYIDPPYNTGNDFVYPDNFRDGLRQYQLFSGQIAEDGSKLTSNGDHSGRMHSRWLSMMYPRLQLAKSLLRDDGVIFISIDDHELNSLRLVMDEIFGEENFLATVVWQKKYAPSNDTVDFSYVHEYLVSYAKSRKFNETGKAVALLKRRERTEENNKAYKNPDNDPRGDWKAGDYTCNKTAEQRPNLYFAITQPKTDALVMPNPSRVWAYSKEAHNENVQDNRVWWGVDQSNPVPSYKRFLSEVSGLVSDTWWEHGDVGHTDEAKKELRTLLGADSDAFDTPKPTRLLRRLLELATDADSDDLVMDFFAGSGTLGQAVLAQNHADHGNRRFILVQIPEATPNSNFPTISSVTRERVRRAAHKIRESMNGSLKLSDPPDLGFRAFTLDSSNFKIWDTENPDLEGQLLALVQNVVDGRSEDDILFELLLKSGLPLSSTVTTLTVAGKRVYSGSDGQLLICLERPITAEVLRGMIALKPAQVLCLDVAFEGDDALKTNIVLEMRDRDVRFRTV